jgi:hypothetical protein
MPIPSLDDRAVLELAKHSDLYPRLARLVLLVAGALDPKMRLAVGGAVAAYDAGWQRHTQDLDIFARPVSARRLVKRLAAQGALTFWITDAHAVVYLAEDNAEALAAHESPSIRVDVLSTVTEPEAGAIRTAVPAKRLGVAIKVFRADHLAAIKYIAGRPLDLVDFDELILRGADVERVRYLVALYEPKRVAAMMARVRKLQKPPSGVRDGGAMAGRYLGREEFRRAFYAALDNATR